MGLMTATGPLSARPAGRFNFEPPAPGRALYLEPSPKRVRVVVGGQTIADSRRAMLLQEGGHQPVYYFPAQDVRTDVLQRSDHHTHCPKKGEASYWSIQVGDRVVKDAAWFYPSPLPEASFLDGLIAFYFRKMDQWLEEDEEIFGHPRDPYHRIDVLPTSRLVRISLEGELLAESSSAVALFESNLPPRWYLPAGDVGAALEPSATDTLCPYKGRASYHSVRLGDGRVVEDLVWYYRDPLPEVGRIKDRLCFWDEKVDVELDGEAQERPASPWAHAGR